MVTRTSCRRGICFEVLKKSSVNVSVACFGSSKLQRHQQLSARLEVAFSRNLAQPQRRAGVLST